MKKLFNISFVIAALFLAACEGPVGPPGPAGEDGFIGSVFEIEGDFTAGNNYTLYTEYPNSITVYDSDVVLVYILWMVEDGIDIWRLCPQTVVTDDGVIQYNFDYTNADVQVFMEFTVPENSLRPDETDNQIFRIAVLPADFAALKSVDVNDINSILDAPNLQLNTTKRVELKALPELKVD